MQMLESTLGLENIKLIHLNDIEGQRGCKQDKHTIPGQGSIDLAILQRIAYNQAFSAIPKIIELPPAPPETILAVLSQFK